jgi:hypothetical protein
MHCFERAYLSRETAVAKAYYLRELALNFSLGSRQSGNSRSKAFRFAADAFIDCTTVATNQKHTYFVNAGDCYERSGSHLQAAEAYLDGRQFTRAAQSYLKAHLFDEVVEVINAHRGEMDAEVVEDLTGIARLFYFKEQQLEYVSCFSDSPDFSSLIRKATQLFPSHEEVLEFTEDYDLDIARATLLEKAGRTLEAAELHLAEGRTLEGIELLLNDTTNEAALLRGQECVLHGLWHCLSFGVDPEILRSNETLKGLLLHGEELLRSSLKSNVRAEVCSTAELSSSSLIPDSRIDPSLSGNRRRRSCTTTATRRDALSPRQ